MTTGAAEGSLRPERPPAGVRASAEAPVGTGLRVALWIGLVFAFAPALRTGLAGFEAQPWTRGTLVFLLLAWIAGRSSPATPRARSGWLLVLLGIGIELAAIGGGVARVGRLGFVVAAIGLSRATGGSSLPAALLLGFLLPLPHAVMALFSPQLESALAAMAAGIASPFGFEVEAGRGLLTARGAILRLSDPDGGLGLLVLFVGLVGFAGLRASIREPLRWSLLVLLGAGAALTVQLLALTLAAAALAGGSGDAALRARSILDHLPWIATWAAGIGLGWRYRPNDGARPRGPIDGGA